MSNHNNEGEFPMGREEDARREGDLSDLVDEIVDELDPARIEMEADHYGLTTDEFMGRVVTELRARIRS